VRKVRVPEMITIKNLMFSRRKNICKSMVNMRKKTLMEITGTRMTMATRETNKKKKRKKEIKYHTVTTVSTIMKQINSHQLKTRRNT
jgi:hypothetical protein